MAKKIKAKIVLSQADNKIVSMPIVDKNGLPSYSRFFDTHDNLVRIFFENPRSKTEVTDSRYPQKSYIGTGKYSTGKKTGFLIFRDGETLVGADIAKTFAQLMIKKDINRKLSKASVGNLHSAIKSFFLYIASLESQALQFNKLTVMFFSSWLNSLATNVARTHKNHIKTLLDLHPLVSQFDLSSIKLKEKTNNIRSIGQVEFDQITEQYDYSDKELMQILAYSFYEIEQAEKHLAGVETTTIADLKSDYIPYHNLSIRNETIKRLFESGVDGHEKLLKHIYLGIRDEKNGFRLIKSKPNYKLFVDRIFTIGKHLYKNEYSHSTDFEKFLKSQALSLRPPRNKESDRVNIKSGRVNYFERLTLKSLHHELAILIYTMITTGLNLETVLAWKWKVNNKPWYENYDVELGITDKTIPRDKSIVMLGKKMKGKGISKPIATTITVNSPLFNYLKFLDKTRIDNRVHVFSIRNVHDKLKAFAQHYPIINDNGEPLSTIHTRRLRKVFAGHKLISLLKDVKSSYELVAKLKDALNHNQFDTTLFSYILKSGVGNLVLNSAIVALTSDLLEKSLIFSGEIKEDNERRDETNKVFLCDCSDPTKPTHGLQIADRCRKYDMCLGCERSEVYSEHLPAIWYRILQYEDMKMTDYETFKITLEDRLSIAKNTIEQYKIKHTKGKEVADKSYETAVNAMLNKTPLLPPILQFGSL
jgi:hypothetical protein